MAGLLISLLLLMQSSLYALAGKQIPDYLHLCKKSDPNLSGCIINSIIDLKPMLAKGMPEFDVPPIEPLYIKELTAAEGRGIKIVTKDINVKGASDFSIETLTADVGAGKFDFVVTFPKLELTSKYFVDGKILTIPIKGNGNAYGEVLGASGKISLHSELHEEGGETRMSWSGMEMDISVSKGKLQLDNLFGGEKVLGDVVNTAINMNFQTFFRELKPLIEEVLKNFILESANKIVNDLDYNQIFPA